ncbi:MAG: hypothetical protein RIS70_68 [Planctomycetota bacterium]
MFRFIRRRLVPAFFALTIGSLIALLIAEAALRLMGVSYPLPYVPDPYCGSKLRPHMQALFSKEGSAWVSITSDGRRDRERSKEKPEGTYRIAVLGDSYAEALQVDQSQAFWAVLERELAFCPEFQSRNVEVINFGVSGFGTAQELEMLRHYAWDYEPDLILLAFVTGNDIRENSKKLSPNDVRPYYVIEDDELKLDNSFLEHPYYLDAQTEFSREKVRWINQLRVLQVAREAWAGYRNRRAKTWTGDEAGLDAIYVEPQDDEWQEAWSITEQLLVAMRDEVRKHNAEFLVVTLSNGIQVHPRLEVRNLAMNALEVQDLFYPDYRISDWCKRSSIPVLTLAPILQARASSSQFFYHGFANSGFGTGHWNVDGHQLAGKSIAEKICKMKSTDSSRDNSKAPREKQDESVKTGEEGTP